MAAGWELLLRCLGCGYVLSGVRDARCPECGRVFDPNCPSTFAPLHRPAFVANRRLHKWACAASLLPVPVTAAESWLGRVGYELMTRGLTAPDIRFNDAWSIVARAILCTHWVAMPAFALLFVLIGARWRWPGGWNVIALLPPTLLYFVLSFAGFIVLAPRFFTT